MKELISFFVLISIFLADINARAGDYHNQANRQRSGGGASLACAQCHTMHASQGSGGSVPNLIYNPPGSVTLNVRLLMAPTVLSVCRYCHEQDRQSIGAPDIFGPVYSASGGDYEVGEGVFTPSDLSHNAKRHDMGVDVSSTQPPGFTGATESWSVMATNYGTSFTCIYCHDQHGNQNYRNVRPNPFTPNKRVPGIDGVKVTYANGDIYDTPYTNESIFQKNIEGSGDGSDPSIQFKTYNMQYKSPNDQIAGFCGKCHENFYEPSGYGPKLGGTSSGDVNTSSSQWRRHPVGKISIGLGNEHTDPQNLASITGSNRVRAINPDGVDSGADEQPFCFTCHRAHGSTNHSNLIFGSPTAVGGAGTLIRDTCQQCHNQ